METFEAERLEIRLEEVFPAGESAGFLIHRLNDSFYFVFLFFFFFSFSFSFLFHFLWA